MHDVFHYIFAAWDEITADVIKNRFWKALFIEGSIYMPCKKIVKVFKI